MVANEMEDSNVLYKELAYKIVGCFYEVYNELGPAHKEQIYHEALKIAFDIKGISHEDKKKLRIIFKEK
jgi:GxxExxY protein